MVAAAGRFLNTDLLLYKYDSKRSLGNLTLQANTLQLSSADRTMMIESELLDRLEFYMSRLEDWKLQFPYLETFRAQLPGERDGIANFALAQDTLLRQLEYAVSWLDQYIIENENFSEENKANFTYGVFDYLDLEFADSSDQRLTFLGDPPNRNFFIYPRRYWRIKNRVGNWKISRQKT